ncbi:MAG: nucleoside-diphosphate sugar epimerase/dehydratase [Thermodesulfovibrionales bacterium]|nr:nucleoside-diphosphate sugar epimerase/dehydratase [Thermodesulfovibrionales bacterium]
MRKNIGLIIDKGRRYKRILVPSGEVIFFVGILVLSYWLRLGSLDERYVPQIAFLTATVVPIKIILFWLFRLYHISFRFTSLYEIIEVLKASSIFALLFSLTSLVFKDIHYMHGFPRSVIFIDFMLTFIISSGLRLAFRLFYFPQLRGGKGRRVLIVGAGAAGEQLVREMQTSPLSNYKPVAFVDDDMSKRGSIIRGVRVVNGKEGIPEIVKGMGIDEIIVAIPSASPAQLRSIMGCVRESEVKNVKILPGLSHILTGKVTLGDIRGITVEDLLGREPVKIELEKIASYLTGKRILVTGAGGSIGSELCRQLASFTPSSLIMVDIGETELFYIDREIKEKFDRVPVVPIISDVKDMISMGNIFLRYSPQVVFHAAAYKHVPLMETNMREAVLNNIEGTRITAHLSAKYNVEKFIFISTDKAINPTSVMGATKRVAENLLRCWDNEKCRFISVRFGNVLESRGSVVPIFKEQIKNGRPITITHPEMERYLMSITEAVQLVLQAGAIGKGGEVFVLDMGKPVKILDLAREMIRLSGLEPGKDIPIVFTGKRPGEKLFEELLTAEEGTLATKHEKIFIARGTDNLGAEYIKKVESLIDATRNSIENENIIAFLKELVPTYQPESIRNGKGNGSVF